MNSIVDRQQIMNKDALIYAESNFMLILYYGQVTKPKKKIIGRSIQKNLMITDQMILFYDEKKKKPNFWVNLSFIDCDGKQIILAFGLDQIAFLPNKDEVLPIFGIIIDLLQRILTKEHKEKLQINKFTSYCPPVTGNSIVSRFWGYAAANSINAYTNFRYFQEFLMTKSPVLTLHKFPYPQDAMASILDILPFLNHVEQFKICFVNNVFKSLSKSIRSIENLFHLFIETNDKKHFKNFISKIKNGYTAIEGLTFRSTKFFQNEFDLVFDTVNSLQLSTLGFQKNSINEGDLDAFYENFEINNKIIYLDFNNFTSIDIRQLSNKISNISILSLVSCNLQVSNIFKVINSSNYGDFPNLQEIDISGNKCEEIISVRKKRIPHRLIKIIAKNIDWKSSNHLISFIDLIFSKKSNVIHINLSNINFKNLDPGVTFRVSDEWKSFYNYLLSDESQINYNTLSQIHSFGWDYNPLNQVIFSFLKSMKSLKTLSLNSCIDEFTNDRIISDLHNYLESAKKLKTLIMQGSENFHIRSLFSELCKTMEKMKSLKNIDFSYNLIGDNGLKSLLKLLSKKSFEIVIFDGSHPLSIDPIINLFQFINSNDDDYIPKLSYPVQDVFKLTEENKASKKKLKELKELAQVLLPSISRKSSDHKKKLRNNIPVPDISPLDQPFYVYYDFSIDNCLKLQEYVKRGFYSSPKKERSRSISSSSNKYKESNEGNHSKKSADNYNSSSSESYDDKLDKSKNNPKGKRRSLKVSNNDSDYSEEEENTQNKSSIKSSRESNHKSSKLKRKRIFFPEEEDDNNYSPKSSKKETKKRQVESSDYSDEEIIQNKNTNSKKKELFFPSDSSDEKQRSLSRLSYHKSPPRSPRSPREQNSSDKGDLEQDEESSDDETGLFSFPFRLVPVPNDMDNYIHSIQEKYSISQLTKHINFDTY